MISILSGKLDTADDIITVRAHERLIFVIFPAKV